MPPRFLVSFPFPKPSSETSTLASRGANRNNPPISGLPALMEAGNTTVAEAVAEAVATSYLTGILLHCMDASASSAVKFPAAFIESFANGRSTRLQERERFRLYPSLHAPCIRQRHPIRLMNPCRNCLIRIPHS